MKKIDISVCVTTYKRPQTLLHTIASYQAQNYKSSELIICDDSPDIETHEIIKSLLNKDKRIKYQRNKKNLGYCRNLLKSIQNASGKYIFILGDDDIIIDRNTLKEYVRVFDRNPHVEFIYSNILQFDNNFNVTYVYNFFKQNKTYNEGIEALSNIWLKSTFIGGIGLRNSKKISTFYPKDDILFPQVEMIGKLLLYEKGYGHARFSVGMRVHQDQLGFHTMKKERIVGRERHSSIEMFEISDRLKKYTKKERMKVNSDEIQRIVATFLYGATKTIVIAEGTRISKNVFLSNTVSAKSEEKRIQHSLPFRIQLLFYKYMPQTILVYSKELYRNILKILYWREEVKFFMSEKNRIFKN